MPITDVLRPAVRHEHALLLAARPALAALLLAGRFAVPIRRVPRLGWVSADPAVARAVLNDHRHFTLLAEGGVGHLWAQVLGDWVLDLFDGAGHHDLRTRARDLFTEEPPCIPGSPQVRVVFASASRSPRSPTTR